MQVKVVLRRLQNEWQGCDYTLMRKNCNNFCEALACELGVEVPGAAALCLLQLHSTWHCGNAYLKTSMQWQWPRDHLRRCLPLQ